jgi:hypothetical protein
MSTEIESFYTIDQWSLTDSDLVVRLVPDFFNTELFEPVITVSIVDPHNRQEAEARLTAYNAELMVEIKASESTLELWGEYDDVPLFIEGREVRLVRSAYSSQDLGRVVEQLQSQLSSSQAENVRFRGHMSEVEQFVVDLLDRAQARKAMSSRDTGPSDAQIDALSRVLTHIRDA